LKFSPKFKNIVYNSIELKKRKGAPSPAFIETIYTGGDLNLKDVLSSRKLNASKNLDDIEEEIRLRRPQQQKVTKHIRTSLWQSGTLKLPKIGPTTNR